MNKLTSRIDKERLVLGIAAPLLAIVAALVITALVILATGKNPGPAFSDMLTYASPATARSTSSTRRPPTTSRVSRWPSASG